MRIIAIGRAEVSLVINSIIKVERTITMGSIVKSSSSKATHTTAIANRHRLGKKTRRQ